MEASTKVHVALPRNVYALVGPSFEQHVRDQLTYSHWRAAVVSWLLGQGYTTAEYLITPEYREDMFNPLGAYIEHRLSLPPAPPTPPEGLNALFDAINAVGTKKPATTANNTTVATMIPTKKRSHDEAFDKDPSSHESFLNRFFSDEKLDSSDSDEKRPVEASFEESSSSDELAVLNNDDAELEDDDRGISNLEESSSSDATTQLVPYTPNPLQRKRRRLDPPAPPVISEGISTELLAFLMEGKRSDTVFGSNYFVLDSVIRVGKIIEGLRMLKRSKMSIHAWVMMRITAVDTKTRKITCDLSIFDTHLPKDQHVLATYDMDSYALRPIILANDKHDKVQGHLSNWPEHHYCTHTTSTGAVKTPLLTSAAHKTCFDLARRDRAIQGVDVRFTQVRIPTRK